MLMFLIYPSGIPLTYLYLSTEYVNIVMIVHNFVEYAYVLQCSYVQLS